MAVASVRPATAADVDEIIRIQVDTWRTAYAELVPEAAVQRLAGPAARTSWIDAVHAGAGHHVLVATEGEWTVGFCAAVTLMASGAPRASGGSAANPGEPDPDGTDPDDPDPGGRIAALLVEPRWGRRGHGLRLFEAAGAAMLADGAPRGSTWVPEADVASRAFYARRQWEADGLVRVLDAGDRELREIRLAGRLEATGSDPAVVPVPP